MAAGDWWDVDTWIIWGSGIGAALEDLSDQAAANAYAYQMVGNMADKTWTQAAIDTALSILEAVNASTTDDAAAYWYNLAVVWASYDGWATSQGIPYWRELGDFFAGQAGFAIDWIAIQEQLVEDVKEAVKPKTLWQQAKPYAIGAAAVWAGVQAIRAIK